MKLKFIALSSTGEEVEWLRDILEDVPIWDKPIVVITIYYDNQATVFKVDNKNYNEKSMIVHLKHNHGKVFIIDDIVVI